MKNKKVMSFCTSLNIAKWLYDSLSTNFDVKIYHGKDAIIEDCHKKTML
jgi:hypothetical protein